MVFEFEYVLPKPDSVIEVVDLPESGDKVKIHFGPKTEKGEIVQVSDPVIGDPAMLMLMIVAEDNLELAQHITSNGHLDITLAKERNAV